jgi:hypothetical protein
MLNLAMSSTHDSGSGGLLADDDDLPHLPTSEWTSSEQRTNDSKQRQDHNLPGILSMNHHHEMGENLISPMHQIPAQPVDAYFQPPGDGGSNINTNRNGDINVDNIFASMSEEENIFNQAPTIYNTMNSNSIFHNFSNMNRDNNTLEQQRMTLPSTIMDQIPIRKYSDCTNNFSGGKAPITRARNAVPPIAPNSDTRSDMQRLSRLRSDSEVLSKSVGTTSFFPRLGDSNMNERYDNVVFALC